VREDTTQDGNRSVLDQWSDALWSKMGRWSQRENRPRGRKDQRKPGAGRKPMPARQVFSAIVYVLSHRLPVEGASKEYGSASAVQPTSALAAEGFFLKIWKAGLGRVMTTWRASPGVGRAWMGPTGKAPLARECVGPNFHRIGEKNGRSAVFRGRRGIPLSLAVSGANRHDSYLLGAPWELSSVPDRIPATGRSRRSVADAAYVWLPGAGHQPGFITISSM